MTILKLSPKNMKQEHPGNSDERGTLEGTASEEVGLWMLGALPPILSPPCRQLFKE